MRTSGSRAFYKKKTSSEPINEVLTLLCRICVMMLSIYIAILLRGPDATPITTHTRMTIVSLQMLVCALCLLAYFGCTFIVGHVRDAHCRMVVLNEDISDPEPGTLESPVSLASTELSPRQEDKPPTQLTFPQANVQEHRNKYSVDARARNTAE